MKTFLNIRNLGAIAVTGLMMSSCGMAPKKGSSSNSRSAVGDEVVEIPVSMIDGDQQSGFQLADASAYSITVDSCVSGFTGTITEASGGSYDIYKFDQSCLAKLTAFTVGGVDYIPTAGDPFTTWLAGDTAVFEENGNAANTIAVVVSAQLSSPVITADTISYTFSEISDGGDTTVASNVVSEAHTVTVGGQSAPAFTVSSLDFVGMTATGAGQFTFTMECDSAITGAGATTECDSTLLSSLEYKIVEDTYGSSMTLAEAQALFATPGATVNTSTDVVAIGAGGTANGGFNTSTLDGPDQMHLTPNMILIIEAGGSSYTFFNIDVSTL